MKTRAAKVAVGAMAALGLALGSASAASAGGFANIGGNIAWFESNRLYVSDWCDGGTAYAQYREYSGAAIYRLNDPNGCASGNGSLGFYGLLPQFRVCQSDLGCSSWVQAY